MDITFNGKRALVTGAGRGIGRSIAIALAKGGAAVYGVSRTQEDLDSLQKEVPGIKTIRVDLRDWDATNVALEPLGTFDLLVNNAGYAKLQSCLEITPDDFEKHMTLNVRATMQVTQIVAKRLIAEKKGGSVVNVSSVAGLKALIHHTIYGATKAALDSYTTSAAYELGQKGIRVNSVNPFVTNTLMSKVGWSDVDKAARMKGRTPLGRFAEPEEVTDVVMYLLSDRSSFLNGVIMPIDGGFTSTACGV